MSTAAVAVGRAAVIVAEFSFRELATDTDRCWLLFLSRVLENFANLLCVVGSSDPSWQKTQLSLVMDCHTSSF